MWIVLAGNIPIYVTLNKKKQNEISTVVCAEINIKYKSFSGYLPIFETKEKAKIFADKVRRMKLPFGEDVRTVRVELYNME